MEVFPHDPKGIAPDHADRSPPEVTEALVTIPVIRAWSFLPGPQALSLVAPVPGATAYPRDADFIDFSFTPRQEPFASPPPA
jgi:hypothetical protein